MKTSNATIPSVFLLLALLVAALPVAAQVKDPGDIKYPRLPELLIPKPEIYQLDNGMTIFLMEDHELPLVSVFARVRTGSNHEPADKTGLGEIFGQVQREGGTGSMTGDEMDDFLETRAASVETWMGGDQGSASMNCLEQDFDDVFAVFNDVLRDPVFAEDKVELARVQAKTGVARRNDNVGSIVGREFSRLIRGEDSPLSRMTEYATIANITRDDLVAWHGKHYVPNNMYVGVVGDFDSEKMKKKIEATFGSWERGKDFDEPEVAYNEIVEAGVYHIEKSDVTQANIRLGHVGIETGNPDFFAAQVLNEVLAGGFSGRLMQEVRSNKGLAYSVFGGIGSSFLRPGIFQVGMSTKSETMGAAVDALKEEVLGIIERPPSKEEIAQAKEIILNSFIFNYTSRGQILGQQMNYAYYGMPLNFLETYRANIEKVTAADVARVAEKYIHPDQMVLLVVGKSEDYDRPVSSFGEVRELDITIPPPPDTAPELVRSAANLEVGAKLLSRASDRITGDSTSGITSLRMKLTTSVSMQGQAMSLGQEIALELPDRVRQTMNTPMGEISMVINGERGVRMMGDRKMPLDADTVAELATETQRTLLILLGREGLEAIAAGSDIVDGAACEIVAVSWDDNESRFCVDAEGLVLKQSHQGKHPLQRTPGRVDLVFSDYRKIDGRLVPHKQVLNFEGEQVASTVLDAIEFNLDLDPALFEIPN